MHCEQDRIKYTPPQQPTNLSRQGRLCKRAVLDRFRAASDGPLDRLGNGRDCLDEVDLGGEIVDIQLVAFLIIDQADIDRQTA